MLKDETKGQPRISISNIVFATDLLESSRLALDYAVALAHHYGAMLTLVHAFELSAEAQEAEMAAHVRSVSRKYMLSRLDALSTSVRRLGVRSEIVLRAEEPSAAIVKSAEENSADLLVLGTHGIYRGLEHALLGSNAEKILLSTQCPTLTIGRHVLAGIDLNLNFRRIFVISDESSESTAAIRYGTSLGQDLGVECEFLPLSADSSTPYSQKAIQQAMLCVDGLLILGVRNQSAWSRHLHASFAFELIAKSSCPVLSIRER